jgi:hypothetical protein
MPFPNFDQKMHRHSPNIEFSTDLDEENYSVELWHNSCSCVWLGRFVRNLWNHQIWVLSIIPDEQVKWQHPVHIHIHSGFAAVPTPSPSEVNSNQILTFKGGAGISSRDQQSWQNKQRTKYLLNTKTLYVLFLSSNGQNITEMIKFGHVKPILPKKVKFWFWNKGPSPLSEKDTLVWLQNIFETLPFRQMAKI